MSPLLRAALAEVETFAVERGWAPPSAHTVEEAQRLIEATTTAWPAPAVSVEPDGAIALEWEADARGWLKLSVRGHGEIAHEAVIEGDEYEQTEPWPVTPDAHALPDWAHELLRRLWPCDA
ncbi:hypothetical protein [Azohydromonas caseinilytica]|uniref:Uncharacterized protein n=1 Tax=Azohydromonas caseinilytica TaxID=2728836 RepID=A0A848FBI8_9BURK|nr:hypothetical protein [Azohydromonas caseinilytica]NML15683.1 hypothetical protein [Azohydromonas caseinilytica]